MAYFKTDWQYESDIRDGHLVSLLKAKPLFPLLRSNQGWPYSGSFNYHTRYFVNSCAADAPLSKNESVLHYHDGNLTQQ